MSTAIFAIILISILNSIGCSKIPSIIIVGSGPSGVAAAATLLKNNFTDLTILEAERRIGGRIHSVKFGDAVIDLGAQWCHGQKDNIVYDLVNNYNLIEPDDFSKTFYHSSHETVDSNFTKEITKLVVDDIYANKNEATDISLGQYVITRYYNIIIERYAKDYKKIKLASEMLDCFRKEALETEGAFSLFDVSARADYVDCTGPDFHWKGRGYKTILDILLQRYPDPNQTLPFDDKLQLNKEVIKISWDDYNEKNPHRAKVECSDGTVYFADHVIFTPSLGVLKNQYGTLFNPQLPEIKATAIKELGIAAVGKILLYFPLRWWHENRIDFGVIWDEKDGKRLFEEFPFGSSKDDKHWLLDLNGFSSIPSNPNVLSTWFSGESVPLIELLPDDVLTDGVMFVLQKFVGHLFNISAPVHIVRSKWYSNPHFLGTYSFQTVESRKRNISGQVILSQPLISSDGHQTLLFAGEATHPIYYSTVHGAIETGQREANRIINLYK